MKKVLVTFFVCACAVVNIFAQPVADFSGTPTTICVGEEVSWSNLSTGLASGTTYTWSFPGSTSTTSNMQNPSTRTYNTPGTYSVSLIIDNYMGTDTMIKTNYITVLASPKIAITPGTGSPNGYAYLGCSVHSVSLNATGGNSYIWSPATALNTTSGATVIASPTTNITYNVVGTTTNGCTASASIQVEYNTSPPPPSDPIIGNLTTVCSGQAGVTYIDPEINSAATPYRDWTVPSGAQIISGQGTRTISVTFGNTSGNVCCALKNACGSYTPACKSIYVNPTPTIGTIGTINGPATACDNQNGVIYILPAVANAASYSWTVSGGATINSGQGTNTITVTFAYNNSDICVTASNSCNSTAQVCKTVTTASNIPSMPGPITGPTTVCNGQTRVNYSVAPAQDASTYSWTVPAGASVTGGQGTMSVTISYGSSSGTICVTAGNGCGNNTSASCTAITVGQNAAVDSIGIINGPNNVCASQSGVTYSIPQVTGATTYSWTIPTGATFTNGQNTNSITIIFGTISGDICVSASNSCSSSPQKCLAVTVSPAIPSIPGSITGLTTVCSGQSGVNYSIQPVPNATVYTWSVPTGASVTSGQGTNSVTISFGSASGTVCVTAGNACGTSLATCQQITVDPSGVVGQVGKIYGNAAVCANLTGVSYSVTPVSGASTYSWTIPAGATITAGQGTNSITVDFTGTAGDICVIAGNSCSSSTQNCIAVTVDPITPAIPGGITGLTSICSGQPGETYSVSAVANASVYTWTIPTGATITAGQGTNSITLTYGTASGTICVTAGNGCGTSLASCQTVSVAPTGAVGTIGAINGTLAVCANQSLVNFSTIPVANATNYNWTVPTGATITAGQGTASITVTFGTTSGNVCVQANNSCSSTQQSCVAITVANTAPSIPGNISGVSSVCNGQQGAGYSIDPVASATFYTWTTPPGGTVAAGQGSTAATIDFGSTSGNVCVSAGNACGSSLAKCYSVTIDPNPAIGNISTITGLTTACSNLSNVTYTIPSVKNAVTYNWTIPAAATITAGQGTNTITVTFGNVSGNICVVASNSCGSSPQSCLMVTVSPSAPSIPAGITGATLVCSGQVGSYSIAPVPNALSYPWTVPTGATVTSGQGSTNTVITFGTTSGNICVAASNGCGTSLQNCKAITVNPSVLTVSVNITNTTNSANCDGAATAVASGGSGPYTYSWSPSNATTAAVTGLCYGDHTVCVTNSSGCVTCETVNISSPTIIPIITDNGTIKVYPNPANDYIYIEGTLSAAVNLQVNILNMFGQKVIDKSLHTDGNIKDKIHIAGIPTGVYFIELRSGGFTKNIKIIKIQ